MNKKKPLLITGIILTFIIIVIVAGSAILSSHLEGALQNNQYGSFQIQTQETHVQIFSRQITLRNIDVKNDETNQYISASEIKASGIRILPYLFNDEIIIRKLLISEPVITIQIKDPEQEAPQSSATGQNEQRDNNLIRVLRLHIEDALIVLQKPETADADTLLSFRAGMTISNLNIFSDIERITFRDHSAENVQIKLNHVRYDLPGDLYFLQIDSIEYSTDQESLNLENLHLSSRHSRYDIAKQTGTQTDWYDIYLEKCNLEGIISSALLTDTAFIFRKATLEGLEATIFRDKRWPFPDKPDTRLPMEMLDNLPFAIHSDSILIIKADVEYVEHSEESTEPGSVSFNELYASIFNLGTMRDSVKGQTAMSARAKVMNESLLQADFVFPNHVYSHRYSVTGNLAPVKLSAFNSMVEPSAFVRIEDGALEHLNFDFSYDNNVSEGRLELEYQDLKISLLDKEDGSEKKIKTFITETFVLNRNNVKDKNSYQEGTISFERDKKRSVFNYWWKSLFSGIKDILAF